MQSKSKILIVDDSRVMCEFMSLYLSQQYETIVYMNPREALTAVQDGLTVDLIVSDLNMPELDGTEFIEAVRLILPQAPILVVSGAKESEKRIEWLASGADDFLLKPFHPAELSVRISKLFDSKAAKTVEGNFWGLLGKVAAAF